MSDVPQTRLSRGDLVVLAADPNGYYFVYEADYSHDGDFKKAELLHLSRAREMDFGVKDLYSGRAYNDMPKTVIAGPKTPFERVGKIIVDANSPHGRIVS